MCDWGRIKKEKEKKRAGVFTQLIRTPATVITDIDNMTNEVHKLVLTLTLKAPRKMVVDNDDLGPVVQSVVSLTSSLRVISLTVLADSIYNILIFFAEKM